MGVGVALLYSTRFGQRLLFDHSCRNTVAALPSYHPCVEININVIINQGDLPTLSSDCEWWLGQGRRERANMCFTKHDIRLQLTVITGERRSRRGWYCVAVHLFMCCAIIGYVGWKHNA